MKTSSHSDARLGRRVLVIERLAETNAHPILTFLTFCFVKPKVSHAGLIGANPDADSGKMSVMTIVTADEFLSKVSSAQCSVAIFQWTTPVVRAPQNCYA